MVGLPYRCGDTSPPSEAIECRKNNPRMSTRSRWTIGNKPVVISLVSSRRSVYADKFTFTCTIILITQRRQRLLILAK